METWQEAITFADLIYRLTRNFPDAERFGLANQMRRAAVSISSNIAEGCGVASALWAESLDVQTELSGHRPDATFAQIRVIRGQQIPQLSPLVPW